MRFVNKICSIILGSVLFLSGILKLMDPVGAGLVVQEYFALLGLYSLFAIARPVAVIMCLFECFVGCAVITSVWRRIVAWVSAALMLFFTLLTAILWIVNAPMDCGCFGEAVHLTHSQSFIKNVALCIIWLGAFLPFSAHRPAPELRYASFSIVSVFVLVFAVWAYRNIPPMDFTPFAPGKELPSVDAGLDDATLSYCDAQGNYPDSLLLKSKVLVVSFYEPHNASEQLWEEVAQLTDQARECGISTYILAATTADDINGAASDPRLLTNLYFGDRRELMTLNRSNGGATYVENGMIVRKWSNRDLPDPVTLSYISEADSSTILVESNSAPRLKMNAFLLFTFAVMLLL